MTEVTINPKSSREKWVLPKVYGMNVTLSLLSLLSVEKLLMGDKPKLQWSINDISKPPALLSALRDGVAFVIYYEEPDINHTARWTMKIIDHGETMKLIGPRLEPRSLMNDAERYEAWKREI